MNKFIYLSITLLFIFAACHKSSPAVTPTPPAQINSHWAVANTNTTTARILSIQFISADTGFCFGTESGTAFLSKTTDGGLNWNLLKTFDSYGQTFDCFYANSSSRMGVARDGIYLSNDGGNIFTMAPNTAIGSSFFQLQLLKNGTGVAVMSNRIYQSNDLQNWSNVHTVTNSGGYNIICFPDQMNGYAAGGATGSDGSNANSGVLSKTTDGGKTWQDLLNQSASPLRKIVGMTFINADNLWFVTNDQKLIHTPDAGNTWVTVNASMPSLITGVAFQTSLVGFCTANGSIYSTIDGGVTFNKDYTTNGNLYGVFNGKNGKAYVTGDNGLILIGGIQ